MNTDKAPHGDGGGRRRLARLVASGAITAAIAAGVLSSGGLGYAATGLKNAAASDPASQQYGETRPGWGCGDKNHEHTGPPGRQYAPPPPGCTKQR